MRHARYWVFINAGLWREEARDKVEFFGARGGNNKIRLWEESDFLPIGHEAAHRLGAFELCQQDLVSVDGYGLRLTAEDFYNFRLNRLRGWIAAGHIQLDRAIGEAGGNGAAQRVKGDFFIRFIEAEFVQNVRTGQRSMPAQVHFSFGVNQRRL